MAALLLLWVAVHGAVAGERTTRPSSQASDGNKGVRRSGVEATTSAASTGPAPHPDYAAGLGRLLTTEQERRELDAARFNSTRMSTLAARPDLTAPLLINGISVRPHSSGPAHITIWIDGRPFSEHTLMRGLRLRRGQGGEVLGVESQVAANAVEFARAGELLRRPGAAEATVAAPAAQQAQR